MTTSDANCSKGREQIVRTIIDESGVDEDMIRNLIHAFYGKVRQDSFIGPVFARAIGEDWDPHLTKMCNFWSSVMLMTGRYKGNPMLVHLRLKEVRPAHFERWLELFRQTAKEICPPAAAAGFVMRADNIARSLQLGMFYRPNDQSTKERSAAEPDRRGPA